MELNLTYNEDCLETMSKIKNDSIDMIITSPPYDGIRKYNGYSFDFENVAKELYRILKKGGVIVWVIGDQTKEGSESGTSFKQALFFKEIGFNIHDTMIYEKDSISYPEKNRYSQIFEFMFVFSKGTPKTINIIKDRKNKHFGTKIITGRERQTDGTLVKKRKGNLLKEYGSRFNIWRYSTGCNKSTKDKEAFDHPAIYPEELVKDHLISWSKENDLIYDPFHGSGTTGKMCLLLNRNFIASEISSKYVDISIKRINKYKSLFTGV